MFKADGRSRVWLARDGEGVGWVVKRFEHEVVRQRLAWGLGVHPAQREARGARRLVRAGIAVVPVVGLGMEGGRGWLMTRWVGDSVQRVVSRGGLSVEAMERLMMGLGRLAGGLLAAGWWNRDHKASNHVMDGDEGLWMIDVGGVRPRLGRERRPVLAMAGMLEETLEADLGRGLTERERAMFLSGLGEVDPGAIAVLRGRWGTL